MLQRINVVAGILQEEGRILIAQRAEAKHEGRWEFPGGKVESGETDEAALVRELVEELSVDISGVTFFEESLLVLPDKEILLKTFLVDSFNGIPQSLVHAQLKWVSVAELSKYDFLKADVPIVEKLINLRMN
ncbi:MAG: (deoxy)nucleoside triphosphate pyrophosphohydrolase [Lentisphaeraceae bacterium]|nr:(deoxy)nucleoside triphosphate pyrophosphohydrolase [Lentisphaeraceae bacterium]